MGMMATINRRSFFLCRLGFWEFYGGSDRIFVFAGSVHAALGRVERIVHDFGRLGHRSLNSVELNSVRLIGS